MAGRLADYLALVRGLREKGYRLGPVAWYFEGYEPPFVFLRHDVDRLVFRAEAMARGEHDLGVESTYYFRCDARGGFPEKAIERIRTLGHEVGFHYETWSRSGGDVGKAREMFARELGVLRGLAEVRTVAPHGSPLSRRTNVDFSRQLDLGGLAILGDVQSDVDFHRVLYVTDTGGVFGSRYNRFDRVEGKSLEGAMTPAELGAMLRPENEPLVLLNTHPERWPQTAPGLVQASLFDGLANLLKVLAAKGAASRR